MKGFVVLIVVLVMWGSFIMGHFPDMKFYRMLKDSLVLKLFGISLKSCVRECETRPACISINYRRMYHECHLNDKDEDVASLERTPGFVYLKLKVSSGQCEANTCSHSQVCSQAPTATCDIKECSDTFDYSSDVYGNQVAVESRRWVICQNKTLSTVINIFPECQTDGLWTLSDVALKCLDICTDYLVTGSHPIPDDALTATSSWDENNEHFPPSNARLTSADCWASANKSLNNYIQARFPGLKLVKSVTTRGRSTGADQYVTKYMIAYSQSCVDFHYILDMKGDNKTFEGNKEQDTPHTNVLTQPVLAMCVRIQPTEFHDFISLRFDVSGCHLYS